MKYDYNLLKKAFVSILALFFLVACGGAAVAYAQNPVEPTRREQLLNGLKLLIWADPKSSDVTIKLRIHSGAAFDPQGKEGVAALLGEIMFPDSQTKQYFAEELGGSLKIESNQDFIEIAARGRAENFERMLDTVRLGVVSPAITAENLKKVQTAQASLLLLAAQNQDLSKMADAAVRRRLFGEFFPYGRPAQGTTESLAKIDRPDLLLARDRFLTADNATLAISGKVDPKFAVKAVKQFFGSWSKADKPVPASFRQPEAPEKTVLIVKRPSVKTAEIRFAVRGTARNSADFVAAQIAAAVLQERWQKNLPAELRPSAFVRHETHVLPGIVIFGASVEGGFAESFLSAAQAAFNKTLNETNVSNGEFEQAQTVVLNNLMQTKGVEVEASWLDADTFKLPVSYNPSKAISAATAGSVQTVITGWQKQTPAIIVVTQNEGNQMMPAGQE